MHFSKKIIFVTNMTNALIFM